MANCIGYEALSVDSKPVGPTAATVDGGVACAIFFVDPASEAKALRYRPDQIYSDRTDRKFSAPTPLAGIPLRRGKSIVVAGEGNIRRSLFVTESGRALVHCLYYDRVDVVDLGLDVNQDLLEATEDVRKAVEASNAKLAELVVLQSKT